MVNATNPLGTRLLAVSLGVTTVAEARQAMVRAAKLADIAELRVDYFEDARDVAELLRDRPLPTIVTDRPSREGGRSPRTDRERLDVLHQAARLGAEFVDVEWDVATREVVRSLQAEGTRVIVSRHAFDRMPDDLNRWAGNAAEREADVVKVVGMAGDARDVLPVLRVLHLADRPTIAIAMGEAGIASRVLALRYDYCQLTFAALDRDGAVAPGQLSIADMRDAFGARRIGASTAIWGVLAAVREDTFIRRFNAWFIGHDVNAVAVPFVATADPLGMIASFQEVPVNGWYVPDETIQQGVAGGLANLTPDARRRGRVNSITVRDDRIVGSWVTSASDQVEMWADEAVRGSV